MDRKSVSYSVQGSSSLKRFKAFNALGAVAFSFGDAMLPEIQVSDLPNFSITPSAIFFGSLHFQPSLNDRFLARTL
jgi:hypothetical protein